MTQNFKATIKGLAFGLLNNEIVEFTINSNNDLVNDELINISALDALAELEEKYGEDYKVWQNNGCYYELEKI